MSISSEGGHLISGRRWDKPGTPEKVYYYVGEVWSNMPDLAPDVSVAAAQWSERLKTKDVYDFTHTDNMSIIRSNLLLPSVCGS